MRSTRVRLMGLVAIAALAACSREPSKTDDALQRDLDLANGAMLDLAPQGGSRTQVVSAIERTRDANARPSTTERRQTPRTTPNAPQEMTPEPSPNATDVAVAPDDEPETTPTPAPDPVPVMTPTRTERTPAPLPTPTPTPRRPGGYKSVGEVIRNAPFPINP